MPVGSISVYYFRYKQVSNQQGVLGRLSETEIVNLLPHLVAIATPEIYPPGSIVWHAGELTPKEIEVCRWLTFLTQVSKLTWADNRDWSADERQKIAEAIRKDYDAFEALLESAVHQPVFTLDKDWVATIAPQAFDYQSPARQSPYLIRAMINLSYNTQSIGRVLDPMGGYGQALFECVLRGIDGATLEISPTASQRSAENLRKLLRRRQLTFEESRNKDRHLFVTQTSPVHYYQIVNGDTRQAHQYLPNQQFDSLITDFPYGIRVGSRTEKLVPIDYDGLLDTALPSWKRLLTSNGTIVIAYNMASLPGETVLDLIQKHGFRQRFAGIDLRTWISDKIHRDIVVFEKV